MSEDTDRLGLVARPHEPPRRRGLRLRRHADEGLDGIRRALGARDRTLCVRVLLV